MVPTSCFAPFGSLERSIDNNALKQTQHFFKKMILDILSVSQLIKFTQYTWSLVSVMCLLRLRDCEIAGARQFFFSFFFFLFISFCSPLLHPSQPTFTTTSQPLLLLHSTATTLLLRITTTHVLRVFTNANYSCLLVPSTSSPSSSRCVKS